jgi:hypothetical protein
MNNFSHPQALTLVQGPLRAPEIVRIPYGALTTPLGPQSSLQ